MLNGVSWCHAQRWVDARKEVEQGLSASVFPKAETAKVPRRKQNVTQISQRVIFNTMCSHSKYPWPWEWDNKKGSSTGSQRDAGTIFTIVKKMFDTNQKTHCYQNPN